MVKPKELQIQSVEYIENIVEKICGDYDAGILSSAQLPDEIHFLLKQVESDSDLTERFKIRVIEEIRHIIEELSPDSDLRLLFACLGEILSRERDQAMTAVNRYQEQLKVNIKLLISASLKDYENGKIKLEKLLAKTRKLLDDYTGGAPDLEECLSDDFKKRVIGDVYYQAVDIHPSKNSRTAGELGEDELGIVCFVAFAHFGENKSLAWPPKENGAFAHAIKLFRGHGIPTSETVNTAHSKYSKYMRKAREEFKNGNTDYIDALLVQINAAGFPAVTRADLLL